MNRDSETWADLAEALAFVGNSLLAPMSQTGDVALDPAFWDAFPDFGDDGVREAVGACRRYAEDAQRFRGEGGDAVQRASVEYTRLFVGPPRPAAAPWETFHRAGGGAVGFGEATFEMRRLLREAGLEVSNENNQYADHIGIELLYASVLARRASEAPDAAERERLARDLAAYVRAHPLSWADALVHAAEAAAPDGLIPRLTRLATALLSHASAH